MISELLVTSISFMMKKIDPVETVVVMEEVVTEMENMRIDTRDSWIQWWWMWLFERWSWWCYGGGGCGYRSGGCGGYGYEGGSGYGG